METEFLKIIEKGGDILNPIGLFKLICVNNSMITKSQYEHAIRINYHYKENEKLSDGHRLKIDNMWDSGYDIFEYLKIKKTYTDEFIEINDPKSHLMRSW